MAVVSPPVGEVQNLPTQLNPGEQRVLAALQRLDDSWRIYVQPRLRMDQPEVVAVHDLHGVCAIEVKDWAPKIYRQRNDGGFEFRTEGAWRAISDAPRRQAHRYRENIVEHFFSSPEDDNRDWAVVRATVVLPQHGDADAAQLISRPRFSASEVHRNIRVCGSDSLHRPETLVFADRGAVRVPAAALRRLESQLREPEAVADQRRPLVLSEAAKNLAGNPSGARIRRARGPAGSGKSLGLAARAAQLAAEGRSVLVLSFNITLPHYLHDLAARHGRTLGSRIRNISFIHFHGFCRWARDEGRLAGIAACGPFGGDPLLAEGSDAVEGLVDCARAAYAGGARRRYDAILVDEGQDFKAAWWNFLRTSVLSPGGEMVVAFDRTQDLYKRSDWTVHGCGFSASWTELAGSYRMPPDLALVATRFGERFLPPATFHPPTVPHDHPMGEAAEPTVRRWANLDGPGELGAQLERAVARMLAAGFAPADIAFLCEEHGHGLDAATRLNRADVYVTHVFTEGDGDERRRRKNRFWGGEAGVKGCTVHSFKGWEARALILCILPSHGSRRLAYVAMTRLKGVVDGPRAAISVLNCDRELDDFRVEFERDFGVAEVPRLGGQRRLW